MTSFSTPSFTYKTYNAESDELIALVDFITDRSIYAYFEDIDARLEQTPNKDILNNAYLVRNKENKIIGYVYLFTRGKILEEHYAIIKEERGKGYATSIVKELSENIFDNYMDIDEIILNIYEHNKESMKVARKAGFIKQEKIDEYQKYSKKRH